jgi:hypothetical protein
MVKSLALIGLAMLLLTGCAAANGDRLAENFWERDTIIGEMAPDPTPEQRFLVGLALATAYALKCPLYEIDPGARLRYAESVGVRVADFEVGGRLYQEFTDAVARYRSGHAAMSWMCQISEQKFGEHGNLWPRLLRPVKQ